MHARRWRAPLIALALVASIVAGVPLAAPAAAPKAPVAKRAAATPAQKPATRARTKSAPYRPHLGLAPADEYFGRLGMSVLGVRNKVKDLGLDADFHPEHERTILGNATWVEDAMRDWAKKYPFDRWLPRYAYALEEIYERLPGPDAHKRAVKQVAYLTAYFPQTVYGKIGRMKLAMGVPPMEAESSAQFSELERLGLIDGKVAPTLPPAPAPSAAPAQSPAPAAASPAVTSPEPAATPAPSAAPAASARP